MAKMRVLWAKMIVLCDLETKLGGFPVKIGWFCLKLNFHSDELCKIGTCEWCMQLKIDFLEWWVGTGLLPLS